MFVAVSVEDPRTGIRGTHYVEVSDSLCHPEANASAREREKGLVVLGAEVWGTELPRHMRRLRGLD